MGACCSENESAVTQTGECCVKAVMASLTLSEELWGGSWPKGGMCQKLECYSSNFTVCF